MRTLWLAAVFALSTPVLGPSGANAAEEARTGVEFSVEPGSVRIEVDDKALGLAKDVNFVKLPPGRHKVRLARGGDEVNLELEVRKGQVVQFTYEF
jgi:hypothetical protein